MWLLTRAWIRYLVLFTQLDCFEQLLVNFYYHLIAVATGILYLTKDSSTIFSLIIGSCIFNAPTFLGLEGAADELDAGEDVNAAGQEHREALYPHAAVAAGSGCSPVPLVKVPAPGLVVDMIEEAVLGHEQGVALEWSGCGSEPSLKRNWEEKRKEEKPSPLVMFLKFISCFKLFIIVVVVFPVVMLPVVMVMLHVVVDATHLMCL